MHFAAANENLIRHLFYTFQKPLNVMYESQLNAVLGKGRGSELRNSDITILASVLVMSNLGL